MSNQSRLRFLPLTMLAATVAAGCGDLRSDDPQSEDGSSPVTWHRDIAPLLAEHCMGCHREGGIAPFSMETYEVASVMAPPMVEAVESGAMPPWGAVATDDCAPTHGFADDPRLNQEQMALLKQWSLDGAPEGNPEDAVAFEAPNVELQGVTHELQALQGYKASGTQDEHICFALDPKLSTTQWLTGLTMEPSNLEVAHHAVLSLIPPDQAETLDSLAGSQGYYECLGGAGIPGAIALGTWLPGSTPFETPAGSGTEILPGSRLVVQLHYHPVGLDHAPDQTRVKLRLSEIQPAQDFRFLLMGNIDREPILQPGPNDANGVEFRIPAGASSHTETMRFPVNIPGLGDERITVSAILPHMHYIGVDIQARVLSPDGGQECLVKVPRWDFDWQRTYQYDAAVADMPTVGNGDTLEITCTYDNSLANEFVHRLMAEEGLSNPIEAYLGDASTDEMCIVGLGLLR